MSSLDREKVLEFYEATFEFDLKTESSHRDFLESEFFIPNDVEERLDFKKALEKAMTGKTFRTDWLTLSSKSSDELLEDIKESVDNKESKQRQEEDTNAIVSNIQFRSNSIDSRSNILVDFITRQQREIIELRQLVKRLEETVLSKVDTNASNFESLAISESIEVETQQDTQFENEEDLESIEARYLEKIRHNHNNLSDVFTPAEDDLK